MQVIITEEMAKAIWRILVEVCGAHEDSDGRQEMWFVMGVTQPRFTEYRFGGKLGFGGRFWQSYNRWYVSYYKEDETEERREIVAEADRRLAVLRSKFSGQNPAK